MTVRATSGRSHEFSPGPLIGRQAETESALDTVDRQGALVVIGPVGVGKSRFLGEVVARLAATGRAVTELAATPATAAVPFEAVRPLLAGAPVAQRRAPDQPTRPADELALLVTAAEAVTQAGAVIAVDDAHLLDHRSAALLHRIVREGRAPVVVTVRAGAPAPDAVQALWRDHLAECLDLGPLDLEAARELAARGTGRALGRTEAESLWHRTGGNPLFLLELIEGSGTADDDRELVGAVRKRLAALTPEQRRVVDLLSLVEPAPLAVLDPELEVLEELETAGLITVSGRDLDAAARLHHPLYAEVARADLSDPDRARMARMLADRLAAVRTQVPDAELRACALLLAAQAAPPPELALAAARQALARSDTGLARELAAGAGSNGPDYDATLLLADLDWFAGDRESAEARYAAADRLAANDAQIAEVATARAQLHTYLGYDAARSRAVVAEARARITDPRILVELEAATALVLEHYGAVRDASARVLDHPDRSAQAVWSASLIAAWVAVQHLQPDEAARLVELGRSHAHLADARPAEADMFTAIELGAATAAGRLADAADQGWAIVSGPGPGGPSTALTAMVLAQVEWLRGRWDRTGAALGLALDQLRAFDQFHVVHVAAAHAAMVAAWRGDRAAVDAALAEAHRNGGTDDPFGEVWVGRAEAWRLLIDGDREAAVGRLVEAGHETVRRDSGNFAWSVLALHDAVCLGKVDDVLAELRRATAQASGALLYQMLVAHAEGLARRDGPAVARAAGELEAIGAATPAASAWAHAAELLGSGTAAACRAATRWQVLAERWDPVPAVLGRPPHGAALSDRQLDVARLAAEGCSSPSIAARLGISVRTVDNHLGTAYRRTGLSGRAELGALVS